MAPVIMATPAPISNGRTGTVERSPCNHPTILFPHSGQNLVPASNLAPHFEHSFLGRNGFPHSGQNFAPCVCAPQPGQSAVASLVRSRPLVMSCSWSFCFIWSTVVRSEEHTSEL